LQISSYVDYGINIQNNETDDEAENGSSGNTFGNDFSIGFYLQDDEGDAIEDTDLTATVTGGKIKVAFPYLANGSAAVNCWDNDLRGEFKTTGDSVADANSDEAGDEGTFYLCMKAVSRTTLGTSNLTIKADGVTVWSGSIQVIGDVASLALSIQGGYNRVAADNEYIGQFFKAVAKDAAGQAIYGTRDGFANYDDDYFSGDSLEYHARGANSVDLFNTISAGKRGSQGIELYEEVCDTDDAGDTFNSAVTLINTEGDRVTSNSVSIVCTQAQSKFVVAATGFSQEYTTTSTLTGEADWDESAQGEDDVSGEIEIYAVIKDGTGALMGRRFDRLQHHHGLFD
jgi:hypothetical protein